MLNLGRKPGQSVKIGDVWVTVKKVKRDGSVVLGIDAPPDVKIDRDAVPSVCSNATPPLECLQHVAH